MGCFAKGGKLDAIRLSLVGFPALLLAANYGLENHFEHAKRAIVHGKERRARKMGDRDSIG